MPPIVDLMYTQPSWSTTLLIDSMYFHAAKECYKTAKAALRGVCKARKAFADLRSEEVNILQLHSGDSYEAYDDLEPIYIQMDNAEYAIGAAYGPYFENIAVTHILCATTVEAHINIIAKENLKGKFRDNFEKISIEGKWLFLPKIIGKNTFDQACEPFQSFSTLIKYRNNLIHYKGRKEIWEGFEQGMPKFLDTLGLSLREARRSLKAVKEMILELSKMIKKPTPYWLREGYDDLAADIVTNFFEIKIEK